MAMAKRGRPRGRVGPIVAALRWIDAKVRDAHANWIAIVVGAVALIGPAVVAWYFAPSDQSGERPPAGKSAESVRDRTLALKQPQRFENSAASNEGAARKGTAPAAACDADYAWEQKQAFIQLIETEVRRCERYVDTPIELHYSCRVSDGVYEVELKYQVSGTFNDERLPFSAQYRGVRDIDLSTVNVTPLNGAFENLCRRKREEDNPKLN